VYGVSPVVAATTAPGGSTKEGGPIDPPGTSKSALAGDDNNKPNSRTAASGPALCKHLNIVVSFRGKPRHSTMNMAGERLPTIKT